MPLAPAGGQGTLCEFLPAAVTFQHFMFSIGNKVIVSRNSTEEEK